MNYIGVLAAMDKELKLILPLIKECKEININNTQFFVGKMEDCPVVIAKCGIGKVNAAVVALTMIDTFHVSIIINTGVAGGTGKETKVLDVVLASKVAYHDVWCGPGTSEGQAAGCPPFFECMDLDVNGVKKGLIVSGDVFVSRESDIAKIKTMYPEAMAVDMESAAIAQVCFLKNVPFVALRVISDTPGKEDNVEQYQNFWEDAPKTTFTTLLDIIRSLNNHR